MRDLVGFHKPIGMRHKLGLSRSASILCQQAREIGCQRGQGVPERGGGERRGGAAVAANGARGRMGDTANGRLRAQHLIPADRPSFSASVRNH
jgi:hypothetical protein